MTARIGGVARFMNCSCMSSSVISVTQESTGNGSGNFMVAVMDGSTLWPSGAAVCIDNDCTFSLEELNKRLHRSVDVEKGHKWYDVDAANVRDVTGRKHPAGYVEGLAGFTGFSPIHNVALN